MLDNSISCCLFMSVGFKIAGNVLRAVFRAGKPTVKDNEV
jgi:hypothetical protein